MNFVEPIRDRKKIAKNKNLLRGQKRFRDLLMFVAGINTTLRISDLLRMQVNHFLDEQGRVMRRFWIKERKLGKRHEVVINTSIREAFDKYLAAYPDIEKDRNNFLFSVQPQTITQFPSNAARLGNSLLPFVMSWSSSFRQLWHI
jgi:integrase